MDIRVHLAASHASWALRTAILSPVLEAQASFRHPEGLFQRLDQLLLDGNSIFRRGGIVTAEFQQISTGVFLCR